MITRLKLSTIEQGLPKYRSMLAGNDAYLPSSFESIATVTVGAGGASNIEFTSIPNTYQHLQIRLIARTTRAASTGHDYLGIRMNSDTGSNYSYHWLYGNGTSVTADGGSSEAQIYNSFVPRDGVTASVYGASIIDLHDYANTSKYKTIRTFGGSDANGSGFSSLSSGLWQSTSAITSITIYPQSDSWKQYSHFALYGIKA